MYTVLLYARTNGGRSRAGLHAPAGEDTRISARVQRGTESLETLNTRIGIGTHLPQRSICVTHAVEKTARCPEPCPPLRRGAISIKQPRAPPVKACPGAG